MKQRTVRQTWVDRAARVLILCTLALLVILPALPLLAGCAALKDLPAVEACYVHPVYGQVCVKIGGQVYTRENLTDDERAKLREWIKTQEAGK